LRKTGSTSAAPPATSTATNPRQHRPKDLIKTRRDIHLVKIKYCEDIRPQNQLNAAKEQHKGLCNILQGASVTLHIILLGMGCTIYNTHTLKPFKELGLDSQKAKKLVSKLHVHSLNFAAKLVHTRRALSSTVINSHQEPVSGQACNLPDPHRCFLSFSRWRSFTVLGTKVAPFPYLTWGVVFTACIILSFSFTTTKMPIQVRTIWKNSTAQPAMIFPVLKKKHGIETQNARCGWSIGSQHGVSNRVQP